MRHQDKKKKTKKCPEEISGANIAKSD